MDELQKLYDVLIREGKTNKTFEEFKTQYSQDNSYREKVYEVVLRDGLTIKDKETFFNTYKPATISQIAIPQEAKKKESITELPLAGGGLVPQETEEVKPKISLKAVQKQAPIRSDISFVQKPITPQFAEKKIAQIKKDAPIVAEIKAAEEIFDKLPVKPTAGESQYLKDRLSSINKGLVNKTEEYVVPEMEYQFGDLGFKFEESGALGDYMKVTSPNGKVIEISLDNFRNAKSTNEAQKLQDFIKQNTPQKRLYALEKTMKEQDKKFNSQKQVDDEVKKINDFALALNKKQKEFLVKKSQYESEATALANTPIEQRNTPEFQNKLTQLEQKRLALSTEMNSLLTEEESIQSKSKALDVAVGKYTIAKSKQGSWLGGIPNAMLEGVGEMVAGGYRRWTNFGINMTPESVEIGAPDAQEFIINRAKELGYSTPDISNAIKAEDDKLKTMPNKTDRDREARNKQVQKINALKEQFKNWYYTLPEDVREKLLAEEKDDRKKRVFYGEEGTEGMLQQLRESNRKVLGDASTTVQWSKLKEQDFWGGPFLGVAKSLPAIIAAKGRGAWAQRTANMYSQVTDNVFKEMAEDSDFKDVSENEKTMVVAPIGIAGAVLEEFGFRNVIGSKGLLNSLVARALTRSGTNMTAKSFARFVREDVESMLARGVLTMSAAGLAEFETGAAQQISETTIKEVYNIIKDKKNANGEYMKMFNTPESIGEFVVDIVKAGAQEAIGGFVLGVPSAVSQAYTDKGFKGMSDEQFLMFEAMANDESLQSAFIVNLKNKVNAGEITMEQATQTLNNYRSSAGLFRTIPEGLNINGKKEAMNLLRERKEIEASIEGKDESLVKPQRERINQINEQLNKLSQDATQEQVTIETPDITEQRTKRIAEIEYLLSPENPVAYTVDKRTELETELQTLKIQQDAIQKQTTGQVPIQPTAGISETMEEGKPQAEPQVATQEGVQEEVVSSKTRVNIAPFFNTRIETVQEAEQLRQSPEYESYKETLVQLAQQIGIPKIIIDDVIGGYKNDAGEEIVEISNQITFEDATLDQAEEFAAMIATLAPEVQEASIAAQYVNEGDVTHNTNEYRFKVSNVDEAINALKAAGIYNFSINETEATVTFTDVLDFADAQLQDKIGNFVRVLDEKNINYEQQQYRPTESRYVDKGKRKEIIRGIKGDGSRLKSRGKGFGETLEQAIQRDAAFQGTTVEEYSGVEPRRPAAGNRLFNEPLKTVAEIADRYYQRAFGVKRPSFKGTRKLDKARAKRISDAFEAMKHSPNNAKVREAYSALVKETIEQYKAFLDAGYVIEINNEEPYANSQEMIDDLRNNKRIKIFSTESGFGSTQITERLRKENPLLAKTSFTDINGQPMLVNDLFRAVHDFFGHAELGNGFGALGEENAWNVHARMFSPLARRAMTTETRGQNSYVNFSGVNDKANRLRDEARRLREEGKIKEALALTNQIYEMTTFADQKIGLLPEEFSKIDVEKEAEAEVEPEIEEVQGALDELMQLDPNNKSTGQKIIDGLDNLIKDIENFEKGTLGVNIALPVMKVILKSIKALVQAGMTLQEAIKKAAADNNVTVRDITNGINAINQMLPIQAEYDALMTKADALIARQKSRNIDDKKILSNLETMIRNSDVYKNANDTQRKIMEREARIKMGVGPRKAASIGRVIGVLKDITNVSRAEKLKIISRIRELSRDVAKDLAQEIRDLAKTGKITPVQAANIISRFGKVNLLNEISVSNFVDYMAKVFSDADYDNKINVAKSKLKKARKNIATKIGIADGLMMPLQKLFSINPELIPDTYLERYLELLDMFSARQEVLTLEEKSVVKNDVDAILNEINNEQSRVDELAEMFNNSDNQVFEDGELNYADSIKKMLSEKEITEEDAELLRKYKKDILPQVQATPLTEEEVNEKKKEYIDALRQVIIDGNGLPSRDERDLAKRLADLITNTGSSLMKLDLTDLKNLLKVADNINNNYLPHYAQVMVEKINAIPRSKGIVNSIKAANPLKFSALYSKFKAAVIRSQKGGIAEMVRRNPLNNIDQVFGNFKTKEIFNGLFEQAAEAEAKFKSELKRVQAILENAEMKVAKSFKLNPDATLMSKFKMMTYMIQLEYESNKGSEQVNPAAAYLKETIKHIDAGKSRFGERDANMLQEILDKYSVDGNIDIEKLYNSFNQAEKDAIKDIREVNESLKDTAQYTAAIIRGDAIDPLNNYVHLNVLHETEPLDVSAATDFLNQANDSRRPSTKAKSLISRTKGAKPLNFDVFASAQRGAKFVLLDYHLTEPIRTARRTINQVTKDLEAEGRLPKNQREVKNAIEYAFEESVSNLLTNSILQNSLTDQAIDFISKQGYRSVLASTGRFLSELTSNVSFALIADPKSFYTGVKYKGIIMSTDAPLIMKNVNSKQTNRIFPSDTLSGKFVDTSLLSQSSGIQGRSSKNPVYNKMQQIWNLTGKKYQNVIELTADALISTPDKIIMRPMWFGSFANAFKKISGSEVDFKKIAENDEAYMSANKDVIEQAKKEADQKSVMTGATDNAFMGILKGTVKPNQSATTRAFNNFNNYMTRFLIFEYVTARTAIYAMVGDGSLSKRQGAAMLAAVATRMTVYTLLSQMLANGIMGIMGDDEDEEETEKSLNQKIGQSLLSTFSSLLIGRDFGNATKLVVNYGLEEVNENYLDFLREGEYDPYKDGIAYSLIPRDDRKDDNLGQLLMNMGGSMAPALNTGALIFKNRKRIITGETEKKEAEAIEREDRVIKERIPLELLGHAGLIPLYKEVRKEVVNSIYSSIKEAEKKSKRKKDEEKDLLGGYENKTELKRYNPELYEKNFGEGSEYYEDTKEERDEKKKQDKLEREIKDRMYNYSPKEESGFGSKGFGEQEKKKKSSEDKFGSRKFGED
jgi:hypothetical protein